MAEAALRAANPSSAVRRTTLRRVLQRKSTVAFFMTLPLILMIAVLVLYPAFYSVHLATLNKSMERFVGFGNFTFLFKRETFWMVVQQSCVFAITAVILKAIIGFVVAHFVHNIPAKGQRKWRGMLLVPWVIPPAMSCLAWLWLFDPSYSAFNWILAKFGVEAIPWTGEAFWARLSVILVNVWIGAPFFMIMYLAALKSVPDQLYEAAEIDGATAWHRFWHVTIPMLTPTIYFNVLISIIGSFQVFTQAYVLTSGGPNNATLTLVLYLYRKGFQDFQFGYASALAWALFVIIMAFTILVVRTSKSWVYYEGEIV